MKLKLLRFADDGETTMGLFFVNGIFRCFTIEDQEQLGSKVQNKTRIPNGTYNVGLRKEGGFHNRYLKTYGEKHKGMLCIFNALDWKIVTTTHNFQYVLLHKGNTHEDTGGCPLLNCTVNATNFIGGYSAQAYEDVYPEIAEAIERGEACTIRVIDIETGK